MIAPTTTSTVFANALQTPVVDAATHQSADALARTLSRGLLVPDSSKADLAIFMPALNRKLIFSLNGNPVPAWASAVVESMEQRWGHHNGWDSYNAKPTETRLAQRLLSILSATLPAPAPAPQITPLTDGGLQASWHTESYDLEISVPAQGLPTYFAYDLKTGDEFEGEVEPLDDSLAHILQGLSLPNG